MVSLLIIIFVHLFISSLEWAPVIQSILCHPERSEGSPANLLILCLADYADLSVDYFSG